MSKIKQNKVPQWLWAIVISVGIMLVFGVIRVAMQPSKPTPVQSYTEQRGNAKEAYVKQCADTAQQSNVARGLAENLCGCAYDKQQTASTFNKQMTQEEALQECYDNK